MISWKTVAALVPALINLPNITAILANPVVAFVSIPIGYELL